LYDRIREFSSKISPPPLRLKIQVRYREAVARLATLHEEVRKGLDGPTCVDGEMAFWELDATIDGAEGKRRWFRPGIGRSGSARMTRSRTIHDFPLVLIALNCLYARRGIAGALRAMHDVPLPGFSNPCRTAGKQ